MRARALAAAVAILAAVLIFARRPDARAALLYPPPGRLFVIRERSRVERLVPEPPSPEAGLPQPLAVMDLSRQLDALRAAVPMRLEGLSWRVGFATDPEFKYYFIAFTRAGRTALTPLSSPRELVHGGVLVRGDRSHVFRARLKARLKDTLHRSELRLWPRGGDPGDAAVWTTGEMLESLERRCVPLDDGGRRFYLAYLSDLDPATGRSAGTRSFLFFEERRFSGQAWAVSEEGLPLGKPVEVRLGTLPLILLRRPETLAVYPAP